MVETAIVLPIYMLVLLGLIYFGTATLMRQRQAKAGAYAAWMPGTQTADQLLGQFWAWNGAITTNAAPAGASDATAGDTEFNVHGGGLLGAQEWVRAYDQYYGNALSPNGVCYVPAQMAIGLHTLGDGGTGVFDRERVEVDLWNFALGATTQSFDWVPGVGIVQRFNTNFTSFAQYLNRASPSNMAVAGGGLLYADDGNPPSLSGGRGAQGYYGKLAASALNGNGVTVNTPWMDRRTVETYATYQPPFFKKIYAEPGSAPTVDSSIYFSGNYPSSPFRPTATTQFNVTVRSGAKRQGVEESGLQAGAFLLSAAAFFAYDGWPANDPTVQLNPRQVNAGGMTMQQAWTAW